MPRAFNFIKKETLAQVSSCKFCEISKNIFSYRTPPVAASAKRCSESGTRNRQQRIFRKVWTTFIQNVDQKINFWWLWWNLGKVSFLQIFLNIFKLRGCLCVQVFYSWVKKWLKIKSHLFTYQKQYWKNVVNHTQNIQLD